MNQKINKPLSKFTEKQSRCYQIAMKVLARYEITRRELFKFIRSSGVYSRDRDSIEVTRMLVRNPETPIELRDNKLSNKLAEV